MVADAGSERGGQGARAVPPGREPASPPGNRAPPGKIDRLPAARIGVVAGVVGMLCCLGPTVLALVGAISAATAYTWAYGLYGGYSWWFRLGGLLVAAGLIGWALRRRECCSFSGARAARSKIVLTLAVAVVTYAVIYGVTSWAGTFAR